MKMLFAAASVAAIILALLAGVAVGHANGVSSERAAIAALPTPTPHIIVRTRIVTRLVPKIVVRTRTVTRVVVATPTPVPTAPPTPTVPTDGPQHPMSGATYCTDDRMCVTLTGYTMNSAEGGDGEKGLVVWFHVVNNGDKDNNVGSNQFAAGIQGGRVLDAEYLCDGPCAATTLVPGGATDGTVVFDVPAQSHTANVRLTRVIDWSDQGPFGSWDVSY